VTAQNLIRRAHLDECALLTDIALRSKASWGYDEQFMANCVAELTINETDIETHQYFVMESAGAVVGFYALREHGEDEGELADLFVEPAHMRAGYGRRLVEHAKSAAQAHGWQSLLVEADPNAWEFYYSCGGAQIGTVASGSIPGRRLPLIRIPL